MRRAPFYGGVIIPLLFILVFLVEGATRPGYNAWRMFVSQLATGPGGWVQTVNFYVFGLSMLAFAIAMRSAIAGTRGSIGAPILLGLFGVAMLVAGTFSTDPGLGYPPGAPQVHTLHGTIHGFAGLAVFTLLPAAAFVMAWHFGTTHLRIWAAYSVAVGVALILFFFGGFALASYAGAPVGIYQRAAIITGWTWLAMVALDMLARELRAGRGAVHTSH